MAARKERLKMAVHPERPERDRGQPAQAGAQVGLLTWALLCLIAAVILLGGYFIYAQFWNRVRP